VTDGLNLPALILGSSVTKSGKMRLVQVRLGSFARIPEYDDGGDATKRKKYIKLEGERMLVNHRTIHKKMDEEKKKLVDDGEPVFDYVELTAGSFFSCYTFSTLSKVSEFTLVWLINVRIEKTIKPNDERPATDFYSCDTVVPHTTPGSEAVPRAVPSPYQSKADFVHMALANPSMETLITPDMRDRDAMLVLMVRDSGTLNQFFMDNCTRVTDHPQVLKTVFSTVFKAASGGNDEPRLMSFNRQTNEAKKCIKFVMEGEQWPAGEVYSKVPRKTKIRLNMNAWSPGIDVFCVRDVNLWTLVGETILNASNMTVIAQVDPDTTSRLQDNTDGSAMANGVIHLSVRVNAFAFDYMRTLARCGLKISATTARQLAEAPKVVGGYNPGTASFRGKHAKDDDALNQKPGVSMISCVSEMTGSASEIFDDGEFEYRFVMPMPDIAEIRGDDLEKMDATLGDLFCKSKVDWGKSTALKDAKGKTVDANHPLRRLNYSTQTVMQGLVFSISKELKTDADTQRSMHTSVGLLTEGIEYPTLAQSKRALPMIEALSDDDDDMADMFGDDDEPVAAAPPAAARAAKRPAGGAAGGQSATKRMRPTPGAAK